VTSVLEVNDLHTRFTTRDGVVKAVNGVSFALKKGEVLGILGESGCGKSVTLRSVMRLLPSRTTKISGKALLNGENLLEMDEEELAAIRGRDISMIFQEPATSLDAVYTVGQQMTEALRRHNKAMPAEEVRRRCLDLLRTVQIPAPERRLGSYPHEMSGGMKQRAMIAIALSCSPSVLFADEPTTSLDVTVQAQVLHLLKDLQAQLGMAVALVSHDIGVIAEMSDNIAVMYAGKIVEYGPAARVLNDPEHPYTEALLRSTPTRRNRGQQLSVIQGQPPNLIRLPPGCTFAPRCSYVMETCTRAEPEEQWADSTHYSRCVLLQRGNTLSSMRRQIQAAQQVGHGVQPQAQSGGQP
jgi:peptide/nickel transport system ATP-binding protein